jgi:hypothetical protein
MTTQDVMKFQNKKMKEGRSGRIFKKDACILSVYIESCYEVS